MRTLARALPALMWVVGWMAVAEVAVRTMPIDRLSRMVGVPLLPEMDHGYESPARPFDLRPVERRRLAVLARVAARWPFGGGPCLRQSLVAGRVLRRLEPALRIGVTHDGAPIVAHAWVEVRGAAIGLREGFVMLAPDGGGAARAVLEGRHG